VPIKGIAFDLEGTVINVEAAHHEGHLAAAADFGLVITLDEAYAKLPHFIGGPDEKVCEDIWHLLPQREDEPPTIADILARDKFHYERLLRDVPIETRSGWLRAWEVAGQLGLKVAIGSLTPTAQADTLLQRCKLRKFFSPREIVLAEDVARKKPAPDVFLETAQRMGINPSEQLVFEDSPNGVRAAIAAGSTAIGMPVIHRPDTIGKLLEAGACRIFWNWDEMDLRGLVKNLERA
jgi:beta-phosphoglucomutase-like phosphatase (HAD superfamily)